MNKNAHLNATLNPPRLATGVRSGSLNPGFTLRFIVKCKRLPSPAAVVIFTNQPGSSHKLKGRCHEAFSSANDACKSVLPAD